MSKFKEAFLGFSVFLMVIFGVPMSLIGKNAVMQVMGIALIVSAIAIILYTKATTTSSAKATDENYKNNDNSNSPKFDNSDSDIGYVNPASGALMISGMDSVDTFGNSYGSDISGSFSDGIGEK